MKGNNGNQEPEARKKDLSLGNFEVSGVQKSFFSIKNVRKFSDLLALRSMSLTLKQLCI
jgi:hypothetical protein